MWIALLLIFSINFVHKQSIRSAEIRSFASAISQNNELIQAVFTVLEEKRYHEEVLIIFCNFKFLYTFIVVFKLIDRIGYIS